MIPKLKPCPFCGHNKSKLTFRNSDFIGANELGDKKLKYTFYVKCNKCHARSKPVKSEAMINPNPWFSLSGESLDRYEGTKYETCVRAAVDEWNRRK